MVSMKIYMLNAFGDIFYGAYFLSIRIDLNIVRQPRASGVTQICRIYQAIFYDSRDINFYLLNF